MNILIQNTDSHSRRCTEQIFLAGRPRRHSPTTPQSRLLYGQHSLQPCKLNPSPRFLSPHFPSLPSEQHSEVQCLLSPNRIQPSSYQSTPQSLDPVLRLRRNSVLESSLEVFLPISEFIPNNQNGLIPALIGKAKAHPINNSLHQQHRGGEQSARETAELFQQL